MLYMYRGRRKSSSSEIQWKSVYSWSKRVTSRTVEDLKGHDTPSQIKRIEQTRLNRSTVQVRASSKTQIGTHWAHLLCCGLLRRMYFVYMISLRYHPLIWGYRPIQSHSVSDFPRRVAWRFHRKVLRKERKASACAYIRTPSIHQMCLINYKSSSLMAPDGDGAICSCAD